MGISRSRHCGRGVDPILAFGRGTGAVSLPLVGMALPATLRRTALGAVALAALVAVTPGSGPRRRAAGRRHDVPDERGQDLPLGRRAVLRQLHPARESRCGPSTKPRLVRDQHGMLTINAYRDERDRVGARLTGHNRQYGRWEARVRCRAVHQVPARRTTWSGSSSPTSGYHCGARSIVLADYALGTSEAHSVPPQHPKHRAHREHGNCPSGPARSTPTPSRSRRTTSGGSSTPACIMTERRDEARRRDVRLPLPAAPGSRAPR